MATMASGIKCYGLHNLYSASRTTTANRKIRSDGHVACTGRRNVNTFVQGKLGGMINEPAQDLMNTVMNLPVT